jgi:glycosyltransferase involved in cell wall biosynthesis
MRPCVSIGLPVFNGERYLEEALNSILAQTYADFELLISDNASTDRTEEICRTYVDRDERVHYSRNERNLGAAPNFNRVFELSSGEFFKWHAYDDLMMPTFLSRCVEVLGQNPEVVLCIPRVGLIDECGDMMGDYDPEPDTSSPEPHVRFRNLVLRHGLFTQTYGLIRADALRRTACHRSFPSSDEVFLAELTLLGQFHEIPERLLFLRIHNEQSTKGALRVERARILWFDTSLKGKIFLPKWAYFFACLEVIKDAPIDQSQRLYCYAQMMRWLLVLAHLRAMGKDLFLAANQLIVALAEGQTMEMRH